MATNQGQYGSRYGQARSGMKQAEQAVAENSRRFLAEIGQLAGRLEKESKSPSVQQNAREIQKFARQVESNEQSELQV